MSDMQSQKTNTVQWFTLAVVAIVAILFFMNSSNVASKEDVQNAISTAIAGIEINIPDVVVPTAKEIADELDINAAPEVVVSEDGDSDVIVISEESSSNKLDDLWEDLYSDEIEELEGHAYNDVMSELSDLDEDDMDDLEDFLEENIEGFDELVSVSEYDDETNIEIINLNPDNDEDESKEADVFLELKVKYKLREGQVTSYKEIVYVVGNVVYEEGNNFNDEEVTVTYSL